MQTCLKLYRTKLVFVKTIHRILRSCLFNVFMLVLGFVLGFGTMVYHVHKNAVRNDQYLLLQELTQAFEEQNEAALAIRKALSKVKMRLSHEEKNFDDTFPILNKIK